MNKRLTLLSTFVLYLVLGTVGMSASGQQMLPEPYSTFQLMPQPLAASHPGLMFAVSNKTSERFDIDNLDLKYKIDAPTTPESPKPLNLKMTASGIWQLLGIETPPPEHLAQ